MKQKQMARKIKTATVPATFLCSLERLLQLRHFIRVVVATVAPLHLLFGGVGAVDGFEVVGHVSAGDCEELPWASRVFLDKETFRCERDNPR